MAENNDDFRILLDTTINVDSIQNQLKNIKGLSVNVDSITLSNSALSNLKKDLKNNNISLNLDLGNTNSIQKQAQNIGKDVGKQLNNAFSSNAAKIEQFKRSLSNMGLNETFIDTVINRINESHIKIESLKESLSSIKGKGKNPVDKNILSVEISGLDQFGNAVTLTKAWDTSSGELIKKLDAVSSATEKANNTTDSFVNKQKQAVSNLRNTLKQVESNATKSSTKPIKQDANIIKLNNQIGLVNNALEALDQANASTFTDAKIKVEEEISALKILVKELQNAEYAATSLRTKDIDTIKIDESNNLDAFVAKMEQSGHYTDDLKAKVKGLKTLINNVGDTDSLTNYLNQFSNLQSEFKKIDTEAKTAEKALKLETNIESEQKQLITFKEDLESSGQMTDEIRAKIEALFKSLQNINTQSSLTTWRAELKGVKSEIDTLTNNSNILTSGQDIIDTKSYEVKFAQLAAGFRKTGEEATIANSRLDEVRGTYKTFVDAIKSGNVEKARVSQALLDKQLKALQADLSIAKYEAEGYDKVLDDVARANLSNKIQTWLDTNTAATKEARMEMQLYLDEIRRGDTTQERGKQISSQIDTLTTQMRAMNKLGGSITDTFAKGVKKFAEWGLASGAVMMAVNNMRQAVNELKEVDTLLTEISKANDKLSSSDLKKIGSNSFNIAGKYGKTATDYLSGVKEMSRAGYQNATDMAELSTAAQGAGDMTAELANQYIIATDKAYKMKGSVEQLTKTLDGANYITNNNAVNMTELADGMSVVGSTAASFGVDVNEATAALGTMVATTQQSGSEVARAFKAILLNIRQVSDEEEGIDAEGLTKYENACNALNVKLKETKNGVQSLRDPMEVLKELSDKYNELDETDVRRANLLSSVGGKLRSTQLDALLRQWDTYEKMLKEYSQGTGSMAREAEKTAKSWEGSLNRLSNTWTSTIDNIANSDAIIAGINTLNGLLGVVDKLTNGFMALPILIGAVYTALSAKSRGGYESNRLTDCSSINNSPFLATVEFSSDVYDPCVHA